MFFSEVTARVTSFWLSIFKRCFNKECKTLFTGYLRTICRSNVLSFSCLWMGQYYLLWSFSWRFHEISMD